MKISVWVIVWCSRFFSINSCVSLSSLKILNDCLFVNVFCKSLINDYDSWNFITWANMLLSTGTEQWNVWEVFSFCTDVYRNVHVYISAIHALSPILLAPLNDSIIFQNHHFFLCRGIVDLWLCHPCSSMQLPKRTTTNVILCLICSSLCSSLATISQYHCDTQYPSSTPPIDNNKETVDFTVCESLINLHEKCLNSIVFFCLSLLPLTRQLAHHSWPFARVGPMLSVPLYPFACERSLGMCVRVCVCVCERELVCMMPPHQDWYLVWILKESWPLGVRKFWFICKQD